VPSSLQLPSFGFGVAALARQAQGRAMGEAGRSPGRAVSPCIPHVSVCGGLRRSPQRRWSVAGRHSFCVARWTGGGAQLGGHPSAFSPYQDAARSRNVAHHPSTPLCCNCHAWVLSVRVPTVHSVCAAAPDGLRAFRLSSRRRFTKGQSSLDQYQTLSHAPLALRVRDPALRHANTHAGAS